MALSEQLQSPRGAADMLPDAIATHEAYDATVEAWAHDQYMQAETPLAQLEALADMSLPSAWRLVRTHGNETSKQALGQSIITGEATSAEHCWSALFHAVVVGSPLAEVHQQATKICQDQQWDTVHLPPLEPMPEPNEYVDLAGGLPAKRPIGEGVRVLQSAYDHARAVLPNDERFHKQYVHEAAERLAGATAYQPKPGEYADALAWTQLGGQARKSLLNLRLQEQPVTMQPGRFIGRSQDLASYKNYGLLLNDYIRLTPEQRAPRARALIEETIRNAQAKNLNTKDLEACLQDSKLSEGFIWNLYGRTREIFFEEATLAHKAIYLQEVFEMCREGTDERLPARVPWLSAASDELIHATFASLAEDNFGGDVAKLESLAAARYLTGQMDVSDAAIAACADLAPRAFESVMALRKLAANQGEDLPLEKLLALADAVDFNPTLCGELLVAGYSLTDLIEQPWIGKSLPMSTAQGLFPVGQTPVAKRQWLANNAEVYLRGGWSKNAIGKLLMARLSATKGASLYTASSWLQAFQLEKQPETEKLYDSTMELNYLSCLLTIAPDERDKLRLSGKQHVVEQLFWEPTHQYIYKALQELHANGDYDINQLQALMQDKQATYYAELTSRTNPLTTIWLERQAFYDQLADTLTYLRFWSDMGAHASIKELHARQQQLKADGQRRKEYITDATNWLLKHATTPYDQIVTAWALRGKALAAGVEDTARSILIWYQQNALEIHARDTESVDGQPSDSELLHAYPEWTDELLRHYTVDETLDAMRYCTQFANITPDLQPAIIHMQHGATNFSGEILRRNDPRGLTIGPDTGCCMSWIDKAKSCIMAGYREPNAGFFALKNEATGRIVAHSYFYVHPGHPSVLVLDSIEANKGRDPARTLALYQQFWNTYIGEQLALDPTFPIRTVQVGIQYSRVDYSALPEVQPVPPLTDVRTDGARQRLLLQYTPGRQSRTEAKNSVATQPEHSLDFRTIRGKESLVSQMETSIYPQGFRSFETIESVGGFLRTKPEAAAYSFMAFDTIGGKQAPLGYCLAYVKNEGDPEELIQTLIIEDLAAIPGKSALAGIRLFREVLERAKDADIATVTFDARESTSYRLVTSPSLRKWVQSLGYVICGDVQLPRDAQDGEAQHVVTMTRQ